MAALGIGGNLITPSGSLIDKEDTCDTLNLDEKATILMSDSAAGNKFKRWWRTDCKKQENWQHTNSLHNGYWDALKLTAKMPCVLGGFSVNPRSNEADGHLLHFRVRKNEEEW